MQLNRCKTHKSSMQVISKF